MPVVVDHAISETKKMTTITNSIEVFDTYKQQMETESDEESFRFPLDDEEVDTKMTEKTMDSGLLASPIESEEDFSEDDHNIDLSKQIADTKESATPSTSKMGSSLKKQLENANEVLEKPKEALTSAKKTQEMASDVNSDKCEEKSAEVSARTEDKPMEDKQKIIEEEKTKEKKNEEKSVEDLEKISETEEAILEDQDKPVENNNEKAIDESEKSEEFEEKAKEIQDVNVEDGEKSEVENQEKPLEPESGNDDPVPTAMEDQEKNECSDDGSEDLLDISIIRDAMQDNAESAMNEAVNRDDEEEADQQMTDKSDLVQNIEYEEDVDGDNKSDDMHPEDDADKPKDESMECDQASISQAVTESINVLDECLEKLESEHKVESDDVKINNQSVVDNSNSVSEQKGQKRPLLSDSDLPSEKRVCSEISNNSESNNIDLVDESKSKKLISTLSLSEFMKGKNLKTNRLTVNDLEEFCLQKICEVIINRSELGVTNELLKQQEQLIATMRKDVQQLSKQARDLEVVNKRLMNDLKNLSNSNKPLNPLRITRSVGLQVKFTSNVDLKKRITQTQTGANSKTVTKTTTHSTATSTVNVSPKQTLSTTSSLVKLPNSPLLAKVLTTKKSLTEAVKKSPPPLTKIQTPDKVVVAKPSSTAANVIDLTDEDDKKVSSPNVNKNIAIPLGTTPIRLNGQTRSIRLATTQAGQTGTPQLMYFVPTTQPSGVGSKTLVVNFQPTTNGTMAPVNGAAVSMIPNHQLKQLKPLTPAPQTPKISNVISVQKHPAPLPSPPSTQMNSEKNLKPIPPKPHLTIKKTDNGIILQWKMPYKLDLFEVIASYQLYAYQETNQAPSTDMWRKVGDVKALALPMACTLTQFADKNTYYFAVRPVDVHKRIGLFSDPSEISL